MYGSIYEYLRISPFQSKEIRHAEDYCKSGAKANMVRRIFRGVSYDRYETEMIEKLLERLLESDIKINTTSQSTDTLLRFLYANEFNIDNTLQKFAQHIIWINEQKNFNITQFQIQIFQSGLMYLGGRDKQQRPTLILDGGKLRLDVWNMQEITVALSILCVIMEDYMFYDSKVENWNIILDCKDRCLVNFPLEALQILIAQMSQNFPQCVERIVIVDASLSINLSWNIISNFIGRETMKKIKFTKSADFSIFKKNYDPDQLEQKYGGKLHDFDSKQFWPPFNTLANGMQHVELIPEGPNELDFQPNNYFGVPQDDVQEEQRIQEPKKTYPEFSPYLPQSSDLQNDYILYQQQQDIPSKAQQTNNTNFHRPFRNITSYIPQLQIQNFQNQQSQQKSSQINFQSTYTVQSARFGTPQNQRMSNKMIPDTPVSFNQINQNSIQ